MDIEGYREALARRVLRCPDVQIEAVLALGPEIGGVLVKFLIIELVPGGGAVRDPLRGDGLELFRCQDPVPVGFCLSPMY